MSIKKYGTFNYGGEKRLLTEGDLGFIVRQVGALGLESELHEPTIDGGQLVISPTTLKTQHLLRSITARHGEMIELELSINHNTSLEATINKDHNIIWSLTYDTDIAAKESLFNIEAGYSWWNHDWPYRRSLDVISPPTGIELEHPVSAYVTRDITHQGKTRIDLEDIFIVQQISESPPVWQPIPANIEIYGQYYLIRFGLTEEIPINQEMLSGEYYVYYGNKDLTNRPVLPSFDYDEYPIALGWDHGDITYTNPGLDWRDNESQVIGARANFTFYGEQIRLYANTGKAWGEMLVTVTNVTPDGARHTEVVDLFNNANDAESLIFEIRDIPDGIHHLRIEDIGTSHPSSSDVRINFTKIEYKKHATANSPHEEANNTLQWTAGMGGEAR